MRTRSQTIFCAMLLLAGNAHAQYYGGVSLGNDRNRLQSGFNGGDAPSELAALNAMATANNGLSLSAEPSVGIKLGYRFTPYFSVEGRYAGRSSTSNIFAAESVGNNIREKTLGLDLVGTLPLMKKMSLLGRAGYRNDSLASGNGETSLNGTALQNNTRGLNSGVVGVGVQYNFNSSVGLRFEVERSRKFFTDRNNVDADNVSFGVFWRF